MTVTVVYDGESAMSAYKDGNFDVAFMDIMMPGKNGVESFFEISKLRPDAKVYMMTGYSVEQLVQQAIEHGAMGVLSKPLDYRKVVVSAVDEANPPASCSSQRKTRHFGPQLAELIEVNGGYNCKLARKNGQQALHLMDAEDESMC